MERQYAISIKAIDHVNLTVSNLERSLGFYQRAFGMEIREDGRDRDRPYLIVGKAGVGYIALHERRDHPVVAAGRINHWGFVVEDFDGLSARLDQCVIPVLYRSDGSDGIIEYPNSRSVYVSDPDGTEIELTSAFGGGLD